MKNKEISFLISWDKNIQILNHFMKISSIFKLKIYKLVFLDVFVKKRQNVAY